jgi:hypothetical protein
MEMQSSSETDLPDPTEAGRFTDWKRWTGGDMQLGQGSGGIGAVSVGVSGLLLMLLVLAILILAIVGLWTVLRAVFRKVFRK